MRQESLLPGKHKMEAILFSLEEAEVNVPAIPSHMTQDQDVVV